MTIGNIIIIALGVSLCLSIIVGGVVYRKFNNGVGGFAAGFGTMLLCFFMFMMVPPWGYVENYELGYVWDARTGEILIQKKTGYVARTPVIQSVHTIDLRPQQVCITSAMGAMGVNSRVLNCKLVSFNPAGISTFLKWHGRGDYDASSLGDLLKIYAYDGSGTNYPFLTINNELKSVVATPTVANPTAAPIAPVKENVK